VIKERAVERVWPVLALRGGLAIVFGILAIGWP